jgi:hypothetical protein
VIVADLAMARVLAGNVRVIRTEQPSTDAGAKAKTFAIKGVLEWRTMHLYDARGVRAYLRGDGRAQRHWNRAFHRVAKRSHKHIVAADAAFRKAGFPRASHA